MNDDRRARLEAAGYRVGDTQAFLGLADEEFEPIKMKVALAKAYRPCVRRTHGRIGYLDRPR